MGRDGRRRRLSFANIVSSVALFAALGGGAYAATGGFVGAGGKIRVCVARDGALSAVKPGRTCGRHATTLVLNQQGRPGAGGARGPEGQPGTRGTQGIQGLPGPSSGAAAGALRGTYPAPTLAPPEPFHVVSSFLHCAGVLTDWEAKGGAYALPAYYRDPLGVVHLRGSVSCGTTPDGGEVAIFGLPPGYTPGGTAEFFLGSEMAGPAEIQVTGSGLVLYENRPAGQNKGASDFLSLDGISFRCEPAGVSGCP